MIFDAITWYPFLHNSLLLRFHGNTCSQWKTTSSILMGKSMKWPLYVLKRPWPSSGWMTASLIKGHYTTQYRLICSAYLCSTGQTKLYQLRVKLSNALIHHLSQLYLKLPRRGFSVFWIQILTEAWLSYIQAFRYHCPWQLFTLLAVFSDSLGYPVIHNGFDFCLG